MVTGSVIWGNVEKGRIVAGPPAPIWKVIASGPGVPLEASIASRNVQFTTSQTPGVPSSDELTVKTAARDDGAANSAPTSAAVSTTALMRPAAQPDRPKTPMLRQCDARAAGLQG